MSNALDKGYTSISSQKTSYLTSSVNNGKNENDTETLDFEYVFPIDKSSGDSTFRQYAPMSSQMENGTMKGQQIMKLLNTDALILDKVVALPQKKFL